MGIIINARVKQKTGTAADFAGFVLLEGEEARVRLTPDGPVWNTKTGPGLFDDLPYDITSPGAPVAVEPGFTFPSGAPGLYIPQADGNYGSITVDTSEDGDDYGTVVQIVWDGTTATKVNSPIPVTGLLPSAGYEGTAADLNNQLQGVKGAVGISTLSYSGTLPMRFYTADDAFVTETASAVQTDNGSSDTVTKIGSSDRVVYYDTGHVYSNLNGRYIVRFSASEITNQMSLGLGYNNSGVFKGILWGAGSGNIQLTSPHTLSTIQSGVGSYVVGDDMRMEFYQDEGVQYLDCFRNNVLLAKVTLPELITGSVQLAARGLFVATWFKIQTNNSQFATTGALQASNANAVVTYLNKNTEVTIVNANLIRVGQNTVNDAQVGLPTSEPPYPYQTGQTSQHPIACVVEGIVPGEPYVFNYGEGLHRGRWENRNLGVLGSEDAFISGIDITADTAYIAPVGATHLIFTLKRGDALEPVLPAGRKLQKGAQIGAGGVSEILGEPILTESAKEAITGNTTYNGEINGVPYKVITSDTYDYMSSKDTLALLFHGNGGDVNSFAPNANMQAYMRDNKIAWASCTIQANSFTVGYGNQPSMNRVFTVYNRIMEQFNFHRDIIVVGGSMGMTTAGNVVYSRSIPVRVVISIGGVPNLRLRFQNGDNADRNYIRPAYNMASDGSDDANFDTFVRGYDWWLKELIVDAPSGTEKKTFPVPLHMYVGGSDGNFTDFGGNEMFKRLRDAINRTGGLSTYYVNPSVGHADATLWDQVLADGIMDKYLSVNNTGV